MRHSANPDLYSGEKSVRISIKIVSVFAIALSLAAAVIWQIFFSKTTGYYLVSAVILFLSMTPFFVSLEKRRPKAREMSLTAALIALAVVSRGVFYMIPQVKPIAMVVIVSAVCLGAERGFVVGAFSAFVSNFLFGQGIWTPFQMVALGLVGFAAGLIFTKIQPKPWKLAATGFVLATVLYGLIVDLSTVLITVTDFSWPAVLAVYASGAVFSLIFGASTAGFLFLFGMPFIKKIDRINTKYGIIGENPYG